MVLQDFHIHSAFCDGENSPEELVLSAIEKGLARIGICVHSPVAFDSGYFAEEEQFPVFQKELARLKDKYKDKIEVLCGIELDLFSDVDVSGFDYVIGSLHYVEADGEFFSVDDTYEKLEEGCRRHFGGDYLAVAERYYQTVAQVAEKTGCDIIGHFDIVAKFNAGNRLFDENDPRYAAAWKAAADRLIASGTPFEINTGGMSREYRSVPYPAPPILDYLALHGARFILSSDAHSADDIAADFEQFAQFCEEKRSANKQAGNIKDFFRQNL